MGAPKKAKKIIQKPSHPWNRQRIAEERILTKQYGLHNKQEIYKAQSYLKRITSQAKLLIGNKNLEQAQKETNQLLKRLNKLGLITEGTPIEDVLALDLKDILDRRLQTVVFQNKLASTVKQARQMIVHGHIFVNGKKIDIPSYIVLANEAIIYNPNSQFNDEEHPEVLKRKKREHVEVKEVPVVKKETEEELDSQVKKEIKEPEVGEKI